MRNIRNIAANRKQQSGFTLVELIVVVAIGFLLVGIGMAQVPRIMSNYRANAEISELPTIVANMQRIAVNRPNWSTFTLDSLIRNDAFPQGRAIIPASGAATATNRWTGTITYASGMIATAGDIARLTYMGVPAAECKAVIGSAAQIFRRIYVDAANSGTVGAGTVVKNTGEVLDEAAVGAACSGEANSITYDISK